MSFAKPTPYSHPDHKYNPDLDTVSALVPVEPAPADETVVDTSQTEALLAKSDKRYRDLKKHHDITVTQLRADAKALSAQLQNLNTRPVQPVAKPTQAEVQAQRVEQARTDKAKLEETTDKVDELQFQLALSRLRQDHVDFDEISVDPEFHAWLETKSRVKQDAIYNNAVDSTAASEVISDYKNYVKATEESATPVAPVDPRATDPSALVSPNSVTVPVVQADKDGKPTVYESQIKALVASRGSSGLTMEEFEEFDIARDEGRYVNDLV